MKHLLHLLADTCVLRELPTHHAMFWGEGGHPHFIYFLFYLLFEQVGRQSLSVKPNLCEGWVWGDPSCWVQSQVVHFQAKPEWISGSLLGNSACWKAMYHCWMGFIPIIQRWYNVRKSLYKSNYISTRKEAHIIISEVCQEGVGSNSASNTDFSK